MTGPATFDGYDAMTVTVAATEALLSLDWAALGLEQRKGAVLLYDQIMQRMKPALPTTLGAHIFEAIAVGERLAAAIRAADGLAPRM
jgi:hypothetical protein